VAQEPTGGTQKRAIRQQRSPNYPSDGLSVALESVKKLYGKAHQVAVDPLTAVKAFGYGALHGPARSRIAALKKYGLIDENKDGSLKLSALALQYLLPADEDEKQAAVNKAGLLPALFQELYPKTDASDEVLKSLLVRTRGFSEGGATQALKAFRDTMALVKASPEGYASPDSEGREGPPMLDQASVQQGPSSQRAVIRTAGAPPVNIALDANTWVTIHAPFPLSKTAWDRMITVLEAMKPGLVAGVSSDPSTATDPEDQLKKATPGG